MAKYKSRSLKETNIIAKKIIKSLKSKFILLNGEIGTGKTTLVQQIAKEIGEKEDVSSPTFVIMKLYEKFVHIDAYRIFGDLEEYEEFFEDKLIIIEWSENLCLKLDHYMKINVSIESKGTHIYEVVKNV